MMQPTWDGKFWQRSPMFEPLAPLASQLPHEHWPVFDDYARLCATHGAIETGSGKPLSFVLPPAEKKPRALHERYESHIYLTGEVPTRPGNWHDLFNALVWLAFPRTKAALNRQHFIQMQKADEIERRGSVRDALTLFDESGVVVACSDPQLTELLTTFQWKELFWRQRQAVISQMRFYLFGHGLYEKALHPYVGMTGNGLVLAVERSFFNQPLSLQLAGMDREAEKYVGLAVGELTARNWAPVPLLGVPGWAEENEAELYYDNADYFRSGRNRLRRGLGGAGKK